MFTKLVLGVADFLRVLQEVATSGGRRLGGSPPIQ